MVSLPYSQRMIQSGQDNNQVHGWGRGGIDTYGDARFAPFTASFTEATPPFRSKH
jgi:hypothetical protein